MPVRARSTRCSDRAAEGQVVDAELFVAVLGASNYTFTEATATQRVADFVASHERAFAYFGGVPDMVVPDQRKSGMIVACRYEPTIQRRSRSRFARA